MWIEVEMTEPECGEALASVEFLTLCDPNRDPFAPILNFYWYLGDYSIPLCSRSDIYAVKSGHMVDSDNICKIGFPYKI